MGNLTRASPTEEKIKTKKKRIQALNRRKKIFQVRQLVVSGRGGRLSQITDN